MSAENIEVLIPFTLGGEPNPKEFTNRNSTPLEVRLLINEAAERRLFRKNNSLLAIKQISPDSQDKLYFYYKLETHYYRLKYFRHNDGPCFEPIQDEIKQFSHIIFKQRSDDSNASETIRIPLLLSEERVKLRFP